MRTPDWQRLALIGICASAAVFLGGCLWLGIAFLAPVLGLFFGGWLLACLLEPLVCWIACRTSVSRPISVAATLLTVCLAVTLVSLVAAPALERDAASGFTSLPADLDAVTRDALAVVGLGNGWLAEHHVPFQLDLTSGSALDSQLQQAIGASPDPMVVLRGVLETLGRLGTMLLLSVFFLLGGPQLAEQVTSSFGGGARSEVRFFLTTVHDSFEGFARAQLLESALFGAGVWACVAAAGIETAAPVAALSGLVLLVPVVGAVFAIAIPVLAIALRNPTAALAIGIVLVLLEQLILNVVGPRLMSRQTGLPPLLVLFGMLVGGQVAGFWGAVFGIPVLATLVTCLEHFRTRWTT